MTAALQDLRVVDLTDTVAGQYCARLFADYGADVLLVEPPGGTATRRLGPFAADGGSYLFQNLNLGKNSVTLDHTGPTGRRLLRQVLAGADVVLAGPDDVAAADVDEACVLSHVSGFGGDGPLRDWKGTELIFQALSGMMYHNGERDRAPLYGCGHRASYAAGVAAYITVLAALHERTRSRSGQRVAVDVAETASSMCYPYMTQYLYNGSLQRRGEQRQPVGEVQCRDGWICFWINGNRWRAACGALDLPGLADDPRFRDVPTRIDNWPALLAEIGQAVRDRAADDVVAALQTARVISARSYDVGQLHRENAHLAERGYWEELPGPSGPRTVPGPQFRLSATPRRLRGGAPAPGSANADTYGRLGYAPDDLRALRETGVI